MIVCNVYIGYSHGVQTEEARRRLRQLILDGAYPAGTRLTEMEVAATLAMSRTPVREAFRALAADGLVRPTGRGLAVIALDAAELDDAYQVRAALETLTAELAATRQRDGRIAPADLASLREVAAAAAEATDAGRLGEAAGHNRLFHRRISELAGNAMALRVLDQLWDQIMVSTLHSLTPAARPAHVNAQHDELLTAIVAGHPDRAGDVARRHVLDTRATANPKG